MLASFPGSPPCVRVIIANIVYVILIHYCYIVYFYTCCTSIVATIMLYSVEFALLVYVQTGNDLVSREHYSSEEVRERIQTLSQEWKQLTTASTEKGERSNEI